MRMTTLCTLLMMPLTVAFLHAQTPGIVIDTEYLTWRTNPLFPWSVQFDSGGNTEARCSGGDPLLGQELWLETTVTGPGAINFDWGPGPYGTIYFDVDGMQRATTYWKGASWVPEQTVGPGVHTLHWYIRNAGYAQGHVWNVRWNPTLLSLAADFDGDGAKDPAVFDSSTATFYYISSLDGSDCSQQWGSPGDIPVPGNYDGGAMDNFAVFRFSTPTWLIRPDGGGAPIEFSCGNSGANEIPLPADYDGDGITDCAVMDRDSHVWTIRRSDGLANIVKAHGTGNDHPVPGNYDSIPGTELAIYRPADYSWHWVSAVNSNQGAKIFGDTSRIPVPADFNGDGTDDWATYTPSNSNWHIEINGGGTADVLDFKHATGAIPVPADYNGDGTDQVAYVESSTAKWFIRRNHDGGLFSTPPVYYGWGPDGDRPVPDGYTIPRSNGCNVAVYRPRTGTWYIRSTNEGGAASSQVWGTVPSTPVRGDFDGDGYGDFAAIGQSDYVWRIKVTGGGADIIRQFGGHGDIPIPADYDGDGITDIAVYRPSDGAVSSRWYIRKGDGSGRMDRSFGWVNDQPIRGDFDGDGAADIAVFREATGMWFIRASGGGRLDQQFGWIGDTPVPADYDGDGATDIAIFREATGMWYIKKSDGTGRIDTKLGQRGDTPVPGDYDLDGIDDVATYREGEWHIRRSSDGEMMVGRGSFIVGMPEDTVLGQRPAPQY
jgi:hypothetical protein